MTKRILVLLFALALSVGLHAQVTIGALTAPTAGALLDLNRGATGGLLLSNVALPNLSVIPANTFVNISTEQDTNPELAGMIVYNTYATTGIGIHVWDGNDWLKPCAPPAPGPITFSSTTICGVGSTFTAKIDSVKGATNYVWELPAGLSGTSNDTIITITAETAGTYPDSLITVRAESPCGGGTRRASTQAVTIGEIPATPGPITFSATTICGVGTTFTAKINSVKDATSYVWSLPAGLTGSSNDTIITITGAALGTYSGGSITVQAVNSFCNGTPRAGTQEIVIGAIPATPGPITFSGTSFCGASTFTAKINSVNGATSYVWGLPNGLTGSSNDTIITITGAVGNYPAGSITVRAVSSSCAGAPRAGTDKIEIAEIPARPGGSISSTDNTFTFTATAPNGHVIDWYDAATGGSFVRTGNSFSETLTVTKTYYAESRNTTTGCVSASRLAFTGTVRLNELCIVTSSLDLTGKVAFVSSAETTPRNGIIFSAPVKITDSKTDFDGGSPNHNYKADYRDHSVDTDTYGSWFSWCMVVQYADVLCPTPWRVPTYTDLVGYSGIINYTSANNSTTSIYAGMDGWLLGGILTSNSPQVGQVGEYWTPSKVHNQLRANYAGVNSNGFWPWLDTRPDYGLSLRCVKTAP
jgi:hypothetical protein